MGVSAQGELGVPDDVMQLGWWKAGASPGAPQGTVVVDGHVDSRTQGRGELFALERASVGDIVKVTTTHGEFRYRVAARVTYRKASLPGEIFSTGGRQRLVLITCGGPFDSGTGHYADNVVVYAVPAV